ncbi:LOW QUALITY PROTEIN: minor histocompatibility antigen H13-like [Tigriopus californicus]|uniref:LOW QUALITY PROTEIN: minor histocompatibility antigen H13-like n=1 Tax=Tigriopus californicus TaxID=6832 RepID=UPI0027DA76BE|nr:LOW QUALITY PROTEIN: minor histocompatibility antigen H13-like [Tigriopus californicus]
MADVENPALVTPDPEAAVAAENLTEGVLNGTTGRIPSTPEGMAVAYTSLVVMALIPIFFGSFRSVRSHSEQKAESKRTGEAPERMTSADAAMFPIIASCALFGLYVFFQIFSKDHINLLLSVYFFVLGIFALTHMVSPFIKRLIPGFVPVIPYHLTFIQGEDSALEELVNFKFTTHDMVVFALSTAVGVWYFLKKHWIANNIFGLAFAINGVELLHLNNVMTGCILLGGLFFYDIFWVFGTNVMVTVAKSFEAPIKLVFPQDLLENGLGATNMAMLGLGDIVIPGIFVALLLRYDNSLKRGSNFYFWTCFLAYIGGLLTTIGIMHFYKHAQPALLYLVPACLGTPTFIALVRGDIKSMFSYADHPEEDQESKKIEAEKSKKKK